MSDFSFTATAECDFCGNLLQSSDQDCDECTEEDIDQHIFRCLDSDGDVPDTITLSATTRYKWHKLEREVGSDWIAYEWLGPRWSVQNMISRGMYESLQDVPHRQMSLDAPTDVGE